jgi:hypothetical protein
MGPKTLIEWLVYWWEALLLTFASLANFRHVITKLTDGVNPYGRIYFKKFIEATGVVTHAAWHPNIVLLTGRYHIADQLTERAEAQMSHLAVGTGTTAAVKEDLALETEIARVALDSRVQGTGDERNKVIYSVTLPAGTGTGPLTESLILNTAVGIGQALCRSVYPVKNKEEAEAMEIVWILTVSA